MVLEGAAPGVPMFLLEQLQAGSKRELEGGHVAARLLLTGELSPGVCDGGDKSRVTSCAAGCSPRNHSPSQMRNSVYSFGLPAAWVLSEI